jgi:hypothetical protein
MMVETRRVKLATCKAQAVNARFMTHEQFKRLEENIGTDGCLTSTPLLWQTPEMEFPEIVSGHHRIKAALAALGQDVEADCLVITDDLSRQQLVARQLAHNAIEGQDDPATLKRLYEELEDVDERMYSGLDDKTLELLAKVDMDSLSEVNLEYMSVLVMFLPEEYDRALAAFDAAKEVTKTEARWLALSGQYEGMLDALQSAREAYGVGNVATALGVVLDVFERNLTELRAGWYDPEEGLPTRKGLVPLESIFGTRTVPAEVGAIIEQAVEKLERSGDVDPAHRWRWLELAAAEMLAN